MGFMVSDRMSFLPLLRELAPACGPSHGRVPHELLQHDSIPQAAVLCKLLQSESLFH